MIFDKLGLQVRKVGSLADLYQEVDRALSNAKNMKEQALVLGLKKLFNPTKHFDICFIKNSAEAFNIHIPSDRLYIYSSLHCMDWSDMDEGFRANIMAMVMDDFRSVLQAA